MCTVLLGYRCLSGEPLVVVANRDEWFHRPTQRLHRWPEGLWAGRDLTAGGTWMGLSPEGRFAVLTNIRQQEKEQSMPVSRGQLVVKVLKDSRPLGEIFGELRDHKRQLAPFNLLALDPGEGFFFHSLEDRERPLTPGWYGLSNANLHTPWPKVVGSLSRMSQDYAGCRSGRERLRLIQERVTNEETFLDEELPPHLWPLTAFFVRLGSYGTRSSMWLRILGHGGAILQEQVYDSDGNVHSGTALSGVFPAWSMSRESLDGQSDFLG
jgi:uncharacterized protein with NRDE domain